MSSTDRSAWQRRLELLSAAGKALVTDPGRSIRRLSEPASRERAQSFADAWKPDARPARTDEPSETNPLREYFDRVSTGPGVWKWLHYFDIYHRHLSKFRGRPVSIVEIGVYSGGSLSMW